MKLLESTRFEALNSALCIKLGDCKILGRIESYSCKLTGNEKMLYKRFTADQGGNPRELQALSPPQTGVSPVLCRSLSGDEDGTLCDTISNKTLFYLIATLNAAFSPDYDFLDARSHEFSKEPSLQVSNIITLKYLLNDRTIIKNKLMHNLIHFLFQWVTSAVDSNLYATAGDQYRILKGALWSAIDDEIDMPQCDIYR